jgi:O-antigen ligase
MKTIAAKKENQLFYCLIGLIVYLPLPLASNRIWAWSIAEVWIFAMTIYWVWLICRGTLTFPEQLRKSKLPLALLAGFAIYTLFQLLPVNGSNDKAIRVLNEFNWNTYALDTHGAMEHWLKTSAYSCLLLLVLALVNTEKHIKTVLTVFFFSGLFQAAYGSFMTLSQLEYGFFIEKTAYIGRATGTFVNRNHFANYMVMSVSAGTALLLMDLSQAKLSGLKETVIKLLRFIMSPKMLLRIGLAVCVVGIVLSRSRMGNVSFFISLAIAGFAWMVLTRRVTRNAMILLTSLIIIDLWVVGNWFGFDKVQQRLQNTSASTETRDEVVRDSWVYIQDHLMTGTGGGSYYAVYPNYRNSDVNGFYDHAHNDYIQFLAEYGIIGSAIMALFVLSSTYTALYVMRRRDNPTMQATGFCSLMVILALVMHSFVDFNLQITANAASAVILMGLSWSAKYASESKKRHQR